MTFTVASQVPSFAVVKPKILGGDCAGTVAEADPSSAFKPGDRVFALTGGQMFNQARCWGDLWC